ncbi:MAG: hypothetical protein BA864_06390 [Desulfuromonadales bacterium C00003093]|nr:MAG: hypothetical protein BA864_06390 [Desulfuromonadales bacterium C00003093]
MKRITNNNLKQFVITVVLLLLLASCARRLGAETAPTLDAGDTAEKTSPTTEEPLFESPTETLLEATEEGPTATETIPSNTIAVPGRSPIAEEGMSKEEALAKVKADLASRLGVTENEISVVSVEAITWNDTSLGCPEKGMMYAQVLTHGYRIILKAGGKQYDYRTDDRGYIKLRK